MKTKLALAVLALLMVPGFASANTVNVVFNPAFFGVPSVAGQGQSLGISSFTDAGTGVTISAWVWNNTTQGWDPSTLWLRDITNDHGVGVCSEGNSACLTSGDINELSNQLNQELITVTIPSNATWISVQVSSLDCNQSSSCAGDDEEGLLYSSDVGPNTNPLSVPWVQWLSIAATTGTVEPTFGVPAGVAGFNTIAFYPFGNSTNNDFLVFSITYSTAVPEPGTLALLGIGLLGIAGVARRKRS